MLKTYLLLLLCVSFLSFVQGQTPVCSPNQYSATTTTSVHNVALHDMVHGHTEFSQNGYISYSANWRTTYLNIGEDYPFTVTAKNIVDAADICAWIDYNDDGIFAQSEMVLLDTSKSSYAHITLSIPNDTNFIGKRRLRIAHAAYSGGIYDPCNNPGGEIEDYVISIGENYAHEVSYCHPFDRSSPNPPMYIGKFILNSIVNYSSVNQDAYESYSINDYTTNLTMNETYEIQIAKFTSVGISGAFRVWIDLDNDGYFTNTEMIYEKANSSYSTTDSVTIPSDPSYEGIRKMRVRYTWSNAVHNACDYSGSGETEDYWVYITPYTCSSFSLTTDSLAYPDCFNDGFISTEIESSRPYTLSWNMDTSNHTTQIIADQNDVYRILAIDSVGCREQLSYLINLPDPVSSFDLNPLLIGNNVRPGREEKVDLKVINETCFSTNLKVSLTIDTNVVYSSSSNPTADSIYNNVLFWDLSNFNFDSPPFDPEIKFIPNQNLNIGDQVVFILEATPDFGDIDKTNNVKSYFFNVINSYDPNDIRVNPEGSCDSNYTQKDETLTYTVRFQNTGNAPAIDVVIEDSLDLRLDLETLKVLTTSHEGLAVQVFDSNRISFDFIGINLIDSFHDEANSHGYVVFEVQLKDSIPSGVQIDNKVYIYFDFNEAIITNTVYNTLVDEVPYYIDTIDLSSTETVEINNLTFNESGTYFQNLSSRENCDSLIVYKVLITTGIRNNSFEGKIKVHPNPANEHVTLDLRSIENKSLQIKVINSIGATIYDERIEALPSSLFTIKTAAWNAGMYTLMVECKGKRYYQKILKH